jgi:hypothetical protein
MATATSFDVQLIAADTAFQGRVKALTYTYCISTVAGETVNNHLARKTYASQILNNPNSYIPNFVWVAAQDQTLANSVVTANGANFTSSTTAATVAAAVTTPTPLSTGATDVLISNAIANAFNIMANA